MSAKEEEEEEKKEEEEEEQRHARGTCFFKICFPGPKATDQPVWSSAI